MLSLVTLEHLKRRVPKLSDRQLHAYRRRYRIYAQHVLVLELEAWRRELERRPQGPTTTLRVPSKLNFDFLP